MRGYIFLLFLFVFVLTACSSERSLQEWEKEVKERPINIAYVGEKPNIEVDGVTFVSYTSVDGGYEALWIDESEIENFTSEEVISDIKSILKDEKLVVFLGESIPYTIASELGIRGYEEAKGGNIVQTGYHLWYENGEKRLGISGVTEDAPVERKLLQLLEVTTNQTRNLLMR